VSNRDRVTGSNEGEIRTRVPSGRTSSIGDDEGVGDGDGEEGPTAASRTGRKVTDAASELERWPGGDGTAL